MNRAKAPLRFVVVLVSLTLAWPAVGGAWRTWFIDGATAVAGRFGATGEARFAEVPAGDDALDVEVVVFNQAHLQRSRVAARSFRLSSRYTGWIDVAFFLALSAATSGRLRRQVPRVVGGLVLVQLGVWARVLASVRYEAMGDAMLELPGPTPPLDAVLRVGVESFVKDNLEAGLLLSLLVWAVVVAPPELWATVLAEPRDEAGSSPR